MPGIARVFVIAACLALQACGRIDAGNTASEGHCSAVTNGAVVEKIRLLEEAGASSNVTGMTVEAAARMFWPEYVSIGPDGSVTPLDEILSAWKPAPWAAYFRIKELSIRASCGMAIAIGLSEAQAIGAPETAKPGQFRWLNVWTLANGEWRLSATQYTRF